MTRGILAGIACGFGIPALAAAAHHHRQHLARRARQAHATGLSTPAQRAAAIQTAIAYTTATRAGDHDLRVDLLERTDPAVLTEALARLTLHLAAAVSWHTKTTTEDVLRDIAAQAARGITP